MEERIRKFMEYKGISSSELADSIGVQRSNVTHVLKSRNKPSFQFIEKMLQVYPELNAKWLLLGTGNMIESNSKTRTLFDDLTETKATEIKNEVVPKEISKKENQILSENISPEIKEPAIASTPDPSEKLSTEQIVQDQFFSQEKPIEKLIVFFNDRTFKVYYPSL